MRRRLLLILFGMSGLFSTARADILTLRQEVVAPNSERTIEVTAFMTETEEDRREVIARLKKSLAEDTAKNPELLLGFEEVIESKGRAPSAAESDSSRSISEVAGTNPIQRRLLPESVKKGLQFRYPDWFVNRSRVVFSVSRGLINTGVSTWSLMVSQDIPFPVALAAGVLTGGISGGFQYFNDEVQKYLTTSITEKLAKGKVLKEGSKFVESLFRWYILEIGFVASIEIVLSMLGHPPVGGVLPMIGTSLVTALAAVGAQGTWDVAVGMITKRDLKLAMTSRALKIVQFRSDFITLGLSALAVTGMVGKLSHLAYGNTLFWAMGISGGAYLVNVMHNDWKCRKLLKGQPSEPKPDPLGTPPVGTSPLTQYAPQRFSIELALPS